MVAFGNDSNWASEVLNFEANERVVIWQMTVTYCEIFLHYILDSFFPQLLINI